MTGLFNVTGGTMGRIKRRKPIRKVSDKQVIINDCKDLLRKILKIERDTKCELCGRPEWALSMPLSLFHIFDRQRYPRIQLYKENLLLACWTPYGNSPIHCHDIWHHLPGSDPKHQEIERRVKFLAGENYRDKLLLLDKIAPPLHIVNLGFYREALRQELNELKGG